MEIETSSIRRARQLLAVARRDGVGRAYPSAVRAEVVRTVREARERGSSLTVLSQVLGLPLTTLSRWVPEPSLLQVEVGAFEVRAEATAAEPIMVELPTGLRVHGLTLDGVVALHRRLS